jgi:hypothetical protein
MAKTDRLDRQIISAGAEHFSFQSERLGIEAYLDVIILTDKKELANEALSGSAQPAVTAGRLRCRYAWRIFPTINLVGMVVSPELAAEPCAVSHPLLRQGM